MAKHTRFHADPDGGEPSIFGPVISDVPDDADAVAPWEDVSWLARHESFAELDRDRAGTPDLESVRPWQAKQESATTGSVTSWR